MANYIGDDYYSPMDKDYFGRKFAPEVGVGAAEVEGKFTSIVSTKIRAGAGAIELQLGGREESTGAEAYGKEAREEIKKLAELNEVDIHSVHVPAGIIGWAGFDTQRGEFSEAQRQQHLNEGFKGIDFAADTTKGGSIVVHTGEFNRPIVTFDDRYKEFESYPGEENEAQIMFVDKESGKVAMLARDISLDILEETRDETTNQVRLMPKTVNWFTLRDELNRLGKDEFMKKHDIPREFKGDMPGYAIYRAYHKKKIQDTEAQYKRWKSENESVKSQIKRLQESDIDEKLKQEQIKKFNRELDYTGHLMLNAKTDMEQTIRKMNNIAPIEEVGLKRTSDSIAQMGIFAMEKTREKRLPRPLSMTPENLGPYHYGGHPDEIIEIVKSARKQMVERLSKKELPDPAGRADPADTEGKKPLKIKNPYFRKEFEGAKGRKKAMKLAKDHIKSTIDTQHLGMWYQYFKRQPGENEEEKRKRFNKWFTKQVEKLADAGVVGNVHVVDGFGRSHAHLPAGQGRLPVREAIDILRAKGLDVPMTSEGWFEGPSRQITETWKATGKSIYDNFGDYKWSDLQDYAHRGAYAPTYLFGEMAPDPEVFKLWTGVPLE